MLNSPFYADSSVAQVWACELDEGRYWCSQRTMYRILAGSGQCGERRRQSTHPPRSIPELVAEAPNTVWSWDITKLAGTARGIWYHCYVVIDIFSRYALGWRVEAVEDGRLAADLVADIIATQGTPPGWLHADGGAAMTSKPLGSLLANLDVTRSHNRPRTSNDNPYSEAQFKTMKYTPDYPNRFDSLGHARAWMEEFMAWYNHEPATHGSACTPRPRCTTAPPTTSEPPARPSSTPPGSPTPNGSTAGPQHPGYPNESPSTTPRNESRTPNLRRLETSHLT